MSGLLYHYIRRGRRVVAMPCTCKAPLAGGSSLPGKLDGRHYLLHPNTGEHRPVNAGSHPWDCLCGVAYPQGRARKNS
jgi:hypothetical protein